MFVSDRVELLMGDEMVRVIGHNAEGSGRPRHYPMEGRLSAERALALTYWSVEGHTLCGVVLVKVAPTGRKMVGRWLGLTTDDPDALELRLVSGKTVRTRPAG